MFNICFPHSTPDYKLPWVQVFVFILSWCPQHLGHYLAPSCPQKDTCYVGEKAGTIYFHPAAFCFSVFSWHHSFAAWKDRYQLFIIWMSMMCFLILLKSSNCLKNNILDNDIGQHSRSKYTHSYSFEGWWLWRLSPLWALSPINTNVKLFSWVQKRNNCASGREKHVLQWQTVRYLGPIVFELPYSDSMESLHLSLPLNYSTVMWVVLIDNYSSLK